MAFSVVIRRARDDDAAALARVQTTSWQETYAAEVPADALSGLQISATEWTERLAATARRGSRMAVWVAEDDDGILGFATVGPDPEVDDDHTGRLYALYVLQRAQGTGVGRRLHQVALGSLAEFGFTEATLWVSRGNATAIRFYELADWRPDGGSRTEQFRGVTLPVLRYRIPLAQFSSRAR